MAAPTKLDRKDDGDRRRWSRYDLSDGVPAELVTEEGRFACRIENVSLGGARLRLAETVRPTGHVRVEGPCRDGPVGRCIWGRRDSIGVQFEYSDQSVDLALTCLRRSEADPTRPR